MICLAFVSAPSMLPVIHRGCYLTKHNKLEIIFFYNRSEDSFLKMVRKTVHTFFIPEKCGATRKSGTTKSDSVKL